LAKRAYIQHYHNYPEWHYWDQTFRDLHCHAPVVPAKAAERYFGIESRHPSCLNGPIFIIIVIIIVIIIIPTNDIAMRATMLPLPLAVSVLAVYLLLVFTFSCLSTEAVFFFLLGLSLLG
jgi:hypothetical protein